MKYDLIGKKFNNLIVIGRTQGRSSVGGIYWDCECICGEIKPYRSDVLRKGLIKSCGCASGKVGIGNKIGSLIVIEKLGRKNSKRALWWKLKCKCGNFIELTSYSILDGKIRSCGCLKNPNGEKHPNYVGYKDMPGLFFHRIENGAVSRNLLFDITMKQVWDLFEKQNRKCALSGLDLDFGVRSRIADKARECTASLDRIDNTKGYFIENVQWLHKHVNKMKNTHSEEYFIEICKNVVKNCRRKKWKKK